MPFFKLTEDKQKELFLLYQNGKTTSELAEIYNLSTVSIRNYLNRKNISINKGKNLHQSIDLIKQMYLIQDLDIVTISKAFECAPCSIHRILIKNKIPIKDSSKVRRKYYINDTYFDALTIRNAYFLGLLWSDGNLIKNRTTFSITLQEQDRDILLKFKNDLEYGGPMYHRLYTNPKYSNQYTLCINNKRLYNNLLYFGLFPNKSTDISFPVFENTYMQHFIRGYFDGDGSVTILDNGQKYISFCGNLTFISQLKLFIEREVYNNTVSNKIITTKGVATYYKVGGNKRIKKLIDFLYKDCDDLYLKRKHDKLYDKL